MFNNNGNSTVAYNNFKYMPQIPYKIIEKLANDTNSSAENLWKILKYPTTDAISNPNLTFAEKMAILWTPNQTDASQENKFSVFLKPLVPSALNDAEEQIQLRIHRIVTKPTTNLEAILVYQFDMITQEFCSMVYDEDDVLVERTDLMEYYILDCLNGTDIGIGTGFLSFDNRMISGYVKSELAINNGKSLYGKSLRIPLRYMNIGKGGICDS